MILSFMIAEVSFLGKHFFLTLTYKRLEDRIINFRIFLDDIFLSIEVDTANFPVSETAKFYSANQSKAFYMSDLNKCSWGISFMR